jgi:hypothetical protein
MFVHNDFENVRFSAWSNVEIEMPSSSISNLQFPLINPFRAQNTVIVSRHRNLYPQYSSIQKREARFERFVVDAIVPVVLESIHVIIVHHVLQLSQEPGVEKTDFGERS